MELNYIIQSLKKKYTQLSWWPYVQDDCKISLLSIIDHIGEVGLLFRDGFVSVFRYHHACRLIDNVAVPSTEPSPHFGFKLPEECYQSGKDAVRAMLSIHDWVEPNDADVHACILLCQHIGSLESVGILEKATKPNTDDLSHVLK